jgi:hypothetical protein
MSSSWRQDLVGTLSPTSVLQTDNVTAQVETLLKDQDPPKQTPAASSNFQAQNAFPQDGFVSMADDVPMYSTSGAPPQDPMIGGNLGILDEEFSWEMIGLGLDEPLPQQDVIDEL